MEHKKQDGPSVWNSLQSHWLIKHSVSPSLHYSFPQHNLAPRPTGWPWRKTITREAEQQYPQNICLSRLGPLTCLTVCLCWLTLRTHACLDALRGPSVRGPSLPVPSMQSLTLRLFARGPTCLSVCLSALSGNGSSVITDEGPPVGAVVRLGEFPSAWMRGCTSMALKFGQTRRRWRWYNEPIPIWCLPHVIDQQTGRPHL